MKEKLRSIFKEEPEEIQVDRQSLNISGKETEKPEKAQKEKEQVREKEIYLSDISLELFEIDDLGSFNTNLRQVEVQEPVEVVPADLSLTEVRVEPLDSSLATQVRQVQVPEVRTEVVDLNLFAPEVEVLSSSWNTELRKIEEPVFEPIILDPMVKGVSIEQEQEVNTRLEPVEEVRSIESLFAGGGEEELPILEELIGFKKKMRIPRSFGESSDSPIVVLIGEGGESEWHIPILYVLNELFREITDRYPRVTFREPDEDNVDSLEPHSLDRFTFAGKIEFLDFRKEFFDVEEFARTVRGRLDSAFLQQFGILAIAVNPGELEQTQDVLKLEGVKVYTCSPDESRYREVCTKLVGMNLRSRKEIELYKFLDILELYEKILERTLYMFSVFVERDTKAADGRTDRQQYPLKVATFMALLNELRDRKKRIIRDFEDLCEFVREIKENEEIEIEKPLKGSQNVNQNVVTPDLTYSSPEGEVYVEIETLVGALEPMKKIDETVAKYQNELSMGKIWVVLRPVSAILHYEELRHRERAYKVLYPNVEVKFKVLTLSVSTSSKDEKPSLRGRRWYLMDMDKFVKEVRRAGRSSQKDRGERLP